MGWGGRREKIALLPPPEVDFYISVIRVPYSNELNFTSGRVGCSLNIHNPQSLANIRLLLVMRLSTCLQHVKTYIKSYEYYLAFTTLLPNSEDDKLMTFFPREQDLTFQNLLSRKNKKTIFQNVVC